MYCHYGTDNYSIDVTSTTIKYFVTDNIVRFQSGDKKFNLYFGDPVPGRIKKLVICAKNKHIITIDENDMNNHVYDLSTGNPPIRSKIKMQGEEIKQIKEQLDLLVNMVKTLQNNVVDNKKECCICFVDIINKYVLDPCGHTKVCAGCIEKIHECPLCNVVINKVIRIYD